MTAPSAYQGRSIAVSGRDPGHWLRGILILGFVAVTAGVVVAHASPASAYELSVYAGTPQAFWVLVGFGYLCGLFVAVSSVTDRTSLWAVYLGGLATVAAIGVPLLRGYAFYGTGDPLSHMGWVRNVAGGELALSRLIYPGLHGIAIFVQSVLGVGLERAMLLSSGVFVVSFIAFVPFLVYALTDDRDAAAYGAFSAMLLLPINNVGIHLTTFPSTLAVFLVPLALLLLVVYMTGDGGVGFLGATGLLLALVSVGMVLLHPQQATNLLLVFVTVSVLATYGRRWTRTVGVSFRPAYGHSVLLALVLAGWAAVHSRISEAAAVYANRVVMVVLGSSNAGTNAVAQRTGSLSAIGVSTAEIGTKLFLVSAVFLFLAAALVAADLAGLVGRVSDREHLLLPLGLSMGPIGAVMVLYMIGGLDTIYFRHLGFIMVLATVLGAIGLWRAVGAARGFSTSEGLVAVYVVLVIGVLTVASLGTVYSSPYIYKSSGHVTEAHLDGYSTAFVHEAEDLPYVGVRTGPDRFRDGILGVTDVQPRDVRRGNRVPFGQLDGDLTAVFEGPRYLTVTSADVQRETVAFRNLRYPERGFEQLGQQPGVNRVVANEGFQLYYVAE